MHEYKPASQVSTLPAHRQARARMKHQGLHLAMMCSPRPRSAACHRSKGRTSRAATHRGCRRPRLPAQHRNPGLPMCAASYHDGVGLWMAPRQCATRQLRERLSMHRQHVLLTLVSSADAAVLSEAPELLPITISRSIAAPRLTSSDISANVGFLDRLGLLLSRQNPQQAQCVSRSSHFEKKYVCS